MFENGEQRTVGGVQEGPQPKPEQAHGSDSCNSWLVERTLGGKQDLPHFLKLVTLFYFSIYPHLLPTSLFLHFQAIPLSFPFPAKVVAKCTDTWLYYLGLSLVPQHTSIHKALLWSGCAPFEALAFPRITTLGAKCNSFSTQSL